MDPKFYEIGPGWPAFVATFALAVAAIVLFRSLTKHLRKVRLEAANAAAPGAGAAKTPPQATPGAASALGVVVEDGDGGGDEVADKAGDGQ